MIKLDRIVCLLCLAILPTLVNAEIPFTAQSMANLQATLDFCGKTKPQEAAKFRTQVTQLVQSLPKKEVAVVLDSDDYKSSYETITTSLGMLSEHDAEQTCQRLLGPQS